MAARTPTLLHGDIFSETVQAESHGGIGYCPKLSPYACRVGDIATPLSGKP